MNRESARLETGGLIDRSKPLKFTFNGKPYTGYQGDTLASALIANGVTLTARSFRYHRPRGIFSAGSEECHAIVCVGEGKRREPNVRATQQMLYQGLTASSQNVWPSLKWDLGALGGWFSRFLPVGFYYKTFQWPNWKWHEGTVRRLAGVAPAPEGIDPDRYDKQHAHCELLIIGGGPTGLASALSAARSGLRIILADDQPEPGGSLLWKQRTGGRRGRR
jgi:sarcosine oxidase subunit alpha